MGTVAVDLRNYTKSVPIRDLRIIIEHILNKPCYFATTVEFSNEQYELFKKMLKMLDRGLPVAKIVRKKEFYSLDFITTENTLDPRPETELIVDTVCEYFPNMEEKYKVLDLGCGTGCISLTLLTLYKNSVATLVDVMESALKVSFQNAKKHGVRKRCKFVQSDWFSRVTGEYDIIVCNPPYVEKDFPIDRQTSYDPEIALFAGKDGMEAYKKILPEASNYVSQNGLIFLEIGKNQLPLISKLIPQTLESKVVKKDIMNVERVIVLGRNAY